MQILAALLGVAEMAGDLTDPDELLAAIVRITPGLVRVDRCVVQGIATELAAALNMAELVGKLDLERQRFEALVGALTDGLVIVDREFRVVHVDAGAEALLGWQSSEIRGRRFYEVFEITEAEASVAWTKDRGGPAPTAKALSLRGRNGA